MNLLNTFNIIIFLSCFSNCFISQNKQDAGFIVTIKGDTLYGFIREINVEKMDRPNSKIRISLENGKKSKYKIKSITSLKRNDEYYETLWLTQNNSLFNEEYYNIENQGKLQLVKCITKDYLSHYEILFIDQESGVVETIDLLKLEDSNVLIRATQGVFGLKKKKVSKYLSNCNEVVTKINADEIKSLSDVVIFYNQHCRK